MCVKLVTTDGIKLKYSISPIFNCHHILNYKINEFRVQQIAFMRLFEKKIILDSKCNKITISLPGAALKKIVTVMPNPSWILRALPPVQYRNRIMDGVDTQLLSCYNARYEIGSRRQIVQTCESRFTSAPAPNTASPSSIAPIVFMAFISISSGTLAFAFIASWTFLWCSKTTASRFRSWI